MDKVYIVVIIKFIDRIVHDFIKVIKEKRSLIANYDLTLWIECSFETALERALQRNQENLPPQRIIEDYNNIYFPDQRLHLKVDRPKSRADAIYINDWRC